MVGQPNLSDEAAPVHPVERQALCGAVELLKTRPGIAQADAFFEAPFPIAPDTGAVVPNAQAKLLVLAPGAYLDASFL